jgi:ubiquinone/menaquinone biosynthesis C-methylase UbiE
MFGLSKLDKAGRLLDLGCGTGQLAIPLSPYFKEVIAMDPDSAMLCEGKRASQRAKANNIKWLKGSSADLASKMGKFRLVVMGRSFHWMNQKRTLAVLYKMIEPAGGVVIVAEGGGYSPWATGKSRWRSAMNDTVKKYLGSRRRAGTAFYRPPKKRFEDFICESPFKRYDTYRQKVTRVWDLAGVIGYSYSRSLSAKPLFGKRVNAFEEDLTKALRKASPAERFVDSANLEALMMTRV